MYYMYTLLSPCLDTSVSLADLHDVSGQILSHCSLNSPIVAVFGIYRNSVFLVTWLKLYYLKLAIYNNKTWNPVSHQHTICQVRLYKISWLPLLEQFSLSKFLFKILPIIKWVIKRWELHFIQGYDSSN